MSKLVVGSLCGTSWSLGRYFVAFVGFVVVPVAACSLLVCSLLDCSSAGCCLARASVCLVSVCTTIRFVARFYVAFRAPLIVRCMYPLFASCVDVCCVSPLLLLRYMSCDSDHSLFLLFFTCVRTHLSLAFGFFAPCVGLDLLLTKRYSVGVAASSTRNEQPLNYYYTYVGDEHDATQPDPLISPSQSHQSLS